MLVHSYYLNPDNLLCSKCISDPNLPHDKVFPIPQVVKQIRGDLQDRKTALAQVKLQIGLFKKQITKIVDENKRQINSKLSDHFEQIISIVRRTEAQLKDKIAEIFE